MNDERLILYYYGELTDGERRQVDAALARDSSLAGRYRALVRDLDGLARPPDPAAPFGLRARLHGTLDRAADLEENRRRRSPPGRGHGMAFLLGVGVTAALALAVGLALRPDLPPDVPSVPVADTPPATGAADPGARADGTFARALQVYFRDSRRDLQALPDAGNGERTAMILDLVEQNRTFARLAVRNDAAELARVLRAFEPVLVRLAAEDVTAEESEALRAQLAFELNVMLTRLTREASEFAPTTQRETST